MKSDLRELYQATQTLFEAFHYLQPRMQRELSADEPLNPETLAGCVLHACMAKVMGEIRRRKSGSRRELVA
jgi:hypothetical protein